MKIIKFLVTFALIWTGVFSIMMLSYVDFNSSPLGWLWLIPSQLIIVPSYLYYKGVV